MHSLVFFNSQILKNKNIMKRVVFLVLIFICTYAFGQQSPSSILTGKLVRVSLKLKDMKAPEPLDTKRKPDRNPKYQALREKINKRVSKIRERQNNNQSRFEFIYFRCKWSICKSFYWLIEIASLK